MDEDNTNTWDDDGYTYDDFPSDPDECVEGCSCQSNGGCEDS